jgi:F-type H+-transporting ATPase subunit gamma
VEDIERVKQQLQNVQSVEPILSSLRTIAAGSWRAALQRLRVAADYLDHTEQVLGGLLDVASLAGINRSPLIYRPRGASRVAMLVVASERGLCGAYNDVVLAGAEQLIAQQRLRSEQVTILTLGTRAENHFRRRGYALMMAEHLPITRVPSGARVRELSDGLIQLRREQNLDAIYVIYSPYRSGSIAEPVSVRWLPVDTSAVIGKISWPPHICETPRPALIERALHDWIHARFYQLIMETTASEQSARFRAMDAASSNLMRIIEELTQSYHAARQHAITMEMLDLVGGSGLLARKGQHQR